MTGPMAKTIANLFMFLMIFLLIFAFDRVAVRVEAKILNDKQWTSPPFLNYLL
jgi:hypothetical protein